MAKEFKYIFEAEVKNSLSMDYSPDADEELDSSVENGIPYVYLNRPGMITLAKALIKMVNGSYSNGFHVHLNKNFNADEPERIVILLTPEDPNPAAAIEAPNS